MMDESQEIMLHDTIGGLGMQSRVNKTDANGQVRDMYMYVADKEPCSQRLKEMLTILEGDTEGFAAHLKLGEWKVVSNQLVPLLSYYRDDLLLFTNVLRVLVMLTAKKTLYGQDQMRHLEQLQGYKEALAQEEVFVVLMAAVVVNFDEDEEVETKEGEGDAAKKPKVLESILELFRHIMSIPDPSLGDPGFTPIRRDLQKVYIQHFHKEGVFDFLLLYSEGCIHDEDSKKAWLLADILYSICAHLDPESLAQGREAAKEKDLLTELMTREKADTRIRAPAATRHKSFGTAIQSRTAEGTKHMKTSVLESWSVTKGSALGRREFQDRSALNEKKQNMFHDPWFIDLEEGSVRDHNQLNTRVKNMLDMGRAIDESVLGGLRKFFEEFQTSLFSGLVHLLRASLGRGAVPRPGEERPGGAFDRPKLLNFISWFLEFHRHLFQAAVATARKNKDSEPFLDVSSVQGAIDIDMIQFSASRLREYGKESNFNPSHLVVTLRLLAQQVKTVDLMMSSKDQDTRDCGEILMQNMVKENLMHHIGWILKNFKTSSHDPRILSYSVEVFHHIHKMMKVLSERKGQKLEFQVEAVGARTTKRSVTTMDEEVSNLAHGDVVGNLFHMLEKYKVLSTPMNSMLVKLIYSIIRMRRENIVVFFELSYFLRIQRIWADPLVRDKKQGKKYQEMVTLLQYILRQFFKCAEVNGCAFVELLFRKVPENSKDAVLESQASEFRAILDNYEDEAYKKVLDQMGAGETISEMRSRKQAMQSGTLPWTAEEDEILKSRYATYAQHPLFADLLAAELPASTGRTGIKVKKRLVELGMLLTGEARRDQVRQEKEERVSLKAARMQDSLDLDEPSKKRPRKDDGVPDENLEADLERLLDDAMMSQPQAGSQDGAFLDGMDDAFLEQDLARLVDAALASQGAPAATVQESSHSAAPATKLDDESLEKALESLLDEENFGQLFEDEPPAGEAQPAPEQGATTRASQSEVQIPNTEVEATEDFEMALESLIDEDIFGEEAPPPQQPSQAGPPSTQAQHHSASSSSAGHTAESDFEPSRQYAIGVGHAETSATTGGSQQQATAASQRFDLEGALESQLEKDPEFEEVARQAAMAGGDGAPPRPKQGDEADVDLELDLESIIDQEADTGNSMNLDGSPSAVQAN